MYCRGEERYQRARDGGSQEKKATWRLCLFLLSLEIRVWQVTENKTSPHTFSTDVPLEGSNYVKNNNNCEYFKVLPKEGILFLLQHSRCFLKSIYSLLKTASPFPSSYGPGRYHSNSDGHICGTFATDPSMRFSLGNCLLAFITWQPQAFQPVPVQVCQLSAICPSTLWYIAVAGTHRLPKTSV